ncbi:MAG: hypothetical protein PVJ84_12065 [Desulfobacteraceae bacterium]|jgi:hypothetical protein
MLRSNQITRLLLAFALSLFGAQSVYAWSFIIDTLDAPLNQCSTCHDSTSDYTIMNGYGDDFLNPGHRASYAGKHRGQTGALTVTKDCTTSGCHSAGSGYPIKATGLDEMDSDGDGFTNVTEISAGTSPGDAGDFPEDSTANSVPEDSTAPSITAFTLPATSGSLTVSITSFTAADNVEVTGYMVTDYATAPSADDSGWSDTAPAIYRCANADVYTLYAWAKDAAGNVSVSSSAQVDTSHSQTMVNDPPVAFAGDDQIVSEGATVNLSGVGSTDDLGIISYSWAQLDGTGGSAIASDDALAVVLSDSSGITPYFITPPVSVGGATLTFRVTVTDGDGAQHSDEVSITVNDNGISAFDAMPGVVSTATAAGDPIGIGTQSRNVCTQLSTLELEEFQGAATTEPAELLYGLVDFELIVNDPANSSITIYFPSPVPEGYKWFKYTDADGWFDFDRDKISGGTGEGALFNDDRTQITLYINDNSEYDDDPTAGIIRDPGGLATGTTVATVNVGSDSFEGGSGCFIDAGADRTCMNLPWDIFY